MNARVATIVVGVVTVLLALAALIYPYRALAMLGFTILNASHSAGALGEVRATYGGVFLVLGVATLLSATQPSVHRGRLTLLGLVWLGACVARLFGVSVDGNPGLFGWLSAAFELTMGVVLVVAAQSREPLTAPVAHVPALDPEARL